MDEEANGNHWPTTPGAPLCSSRDRDLRLVTIQCHFGHSSVILLESVDAYHQLDVQHARGRCPVLAPVRGRHVYCRPSRAYEGPDPTEHTPRRAFQSRSGSRLPTIGTIFATVVALVGVTVFLIGVPLRASATPGIGVWGDEVRPATPASRDTKSAELGTVFVSKIDGWVTALRFYKSAANQGPHIGKLWSSDGQLLATTVFSAGALSGWQTADLPVPVRISKGKSYTVSYRAPHGRYAKDQWVFAHGRTISSGPLTAVKGVYTFGSKRPTRVSRNSNYYVDVEFVDLKPRTTPTPTAGASSMTGRTDTAKPTPTVSAVSPSATSSGGAFPPAVIRTPTSTGAKPSMNGTPTYTAKATPTNSTVRASASSTAKASSHPPSPTAPPPPSSTMSVRTGGGCEVPRHPRPSCTGVPSGVTLKKLGHGWLLHGEDAGCGAGRCAH